MLKVIFRYQRWLYHPLSLLAEWRIYYLNSGKRLLP